MKVLKTILVLYISFAAFIASGQNTLKLKIPSIESSAGRVDVDYEITGSKAHEQFNLEFRFKDRTGKLNARTFTGTYGKNIGIGKHNIVWLTEKDGYVLDKEIGVQISLFQKPKIPVGAHLMKSLVMPGLGDYRLRNGWGYFLITAAAYGSAGSALYFNYAANTSYNNYLRSDDTGKRNDLFTEANNNRNYMYASVAAAATIWAVDMLLVAVKAGKLKKNLTEKGSKYYYRKYNTPIEVESPYTYVNTKTPYDIAIENGEKLLSEKRYEGAKTAFTEAQKVKPGELLPEAKLAQIEKEIAAIKAKEEKELAEKKAKEEEYNKLMKEGNNLFASGDYLKAKSKYNAALGVKQNDETAKGKIKEIEKIEADRAKEAKYDDLMASGNSAYTRKAYETAIIYFTDASNLFPDRAVPKVKIEELETLVEKQKTEKYKAKLAEAETALENKEYTRAKTLFQEASAIKPYEEYPKNRIAMLEATIKEANGAGGLVALFKKCKGAVFYVVFPGSEGVSFGSGFFISEDGLAISNYHVFKGESIGSEIILTEDGSKYSVSAVLEKDEDKDYIIFKVKKENSWQKFPFVSYSKTAPEIGEKVFAIGNPEGLEKTLSDGIVSAFRGDEDELIQITVPITHGSSGGPLFNMSGEVVGITSAGLDVGNLNFAVNIQKLRLSRYKKTITY